MEQAKVNQPGDTTPEQLQASSSLTFARSLFHAGEGKDLFDERFVFASAVSTYYSLFHLGAALILAYSSHPASANDSHASIRKRLEERWSERQPRVLSNGKQYFADPAAAIGHKDVPLFLKQELPEIFDSLGDRDLPGTLRDMREFVSYAPRMVNDGHINVLYSGCQYEADAFRDHLNNHIRRIDGLFGHAIKWLGQGYNEISSRILSGDFVLFEFAELHAYHRESVAKRAFGIYRSICERNHVEWQVWRPEPGVIHLDESQRHREYAKVISSFQ